MKTRAIRRATAVALMLFLPTSAEAVDRGVQFTPSGNQVLANKDVGNERWAITLNNDDGTVTGNVFRTDGPPAFVTCTPLGPPNGFSCSGADPCSEGGTQRGIQQTPDDKRVLVNKDVGDERWAITLNPDQTVTGNVFRADGPSFIVCDPLPAPNAYSCSGADSCAAEPCTNQYSFIDDVTLPASFFAVPTPCNEPFEFIANVTLPADFFRPATADDFVSGVETNTGTPGELRVGAAPIPGPNPPNNVAGVSGAANVSPGSTSQVNVTLGGATAAGFAGGSYLLLAFAEDSCTAGNFVSDYYEIPILTQSSQISLSVTFAENLAGGNFVLCISTLIDGIVGAYFRFAQMNTSAVCGNGTVEAGEVCDPPASQAQCPTGNLCSNDCSSCVPATSCAGRCCPGRDDNCTAEAAPCFCDEFCVTAQDCCADALEQCGFGPPSSPAPVISNLTQSLQSLNSCNAGGTPLGSLFVAQFDYDDPTGDVTPNGSELDVLFQFQPSGFSQSVTTESIEVVSGNGFSGRIQLGQCYRFQPDSSVNLTVGLRDDAGNLSNLLSINTPRPQGAN